MKFILERASTRSFGELKDVGVEKTNIENYSDLCPFDMFSIFDGEVFTIEIETLNELMEFIATNGNVVIDSVAEDGEGNTQYRLTIYDAYIE